MSIHDNTVEPFDGIKDQHKNPPFYFNLLFYGLIVWAVLFAGYYLFSGWSSHAEFQMKWKTHIEQTTGAHTPSATQTQ